MKTKTVFNGVPDQSQSFGEFTAVVEFQEAFSISVGNAAKNIRAVGAPFAQLKITSGKKASSLLLDVTHFFYCVASGYQVINVKVPEDDLRTKWEGRRFIERELMHCPDSQK